MKPLLYPLQDFTPPDHGPYSARDGTMGAFDRDLRPDPKGPQFGNKGCEAGDLAIGAGQPSPVPSRAVVPAPAVRRQRGRSGVSRACPSSGAARAVGRPRGSPAHRSLVEAAVWSVRFSPRRPEAAWRPPPLGRFRPLARRSPGTGSLARPSDGVRTMPRMPAAASPAASMARSGGGQFRHEARRSLLSRLPRLRSQPRGSPEAA